MSLEHIILGALKTPQSGYDLKRWFDEVFHFFWNADQSQIYRTINRLSEQGLVSGKAAPSAIGPDKRVYRTTPKGGAELRRWLNDGPVPAAQRTAIYAQLIFLSGASNAEASAFLDAMKAQADQSVLALESILAADNVEDDSERTEEARRVAFFNRASVGLGLARARATQTFVGDLIAAHRSEFGTGDRGGEAV